MSMTVKLGIATCIVAGVTAYMAYVGSTASWQYFLTVDECLADAPALVNQRIRVSGKIVVGSLDIGSSRQLATFKICQSDLELAVRCTGPLPDNLNEDMDVVVEGRLDESGTLRSHKVITRCASKYAAGAGTALAASAPTSAAGRHR